MLDGRKLYLGARLKRLRRELGLSQTRMAEELGVSPSYLNHLERNQRPLTAQVLVRITRTYDVDVRALTEEQEGASANDLAQVFADPFFGDLSIPRAELTEAADHAPAVAEAIVRLYRSFQQQRPAEPGALPAHVARPQIDPADWVGEHLNSQRNHFPELDEAAEALADELRGAESESIGGLLGRLAGEQGVAVRIVPEDVLENAFSHYDYHRRRLQISVLLSTPGRSFAVAYQLALLEFGELIDALASRAGPPDPTSRRLLRVAIANYAAAALMMPYEAFHAAAEALAYDVEPLARRFGAGVEQAAQRLSSLNRPGARGVPFFMVRTDAAGNLSKRFAGGGAPFSRFAGLCPRWNVHGAFRTAGVVTQVIEMPDGERFFAFARRVARPAPIAGEEERELAVGLGCDLRYAGRLAYARGLDLQNPRAQPVGPGCTLCERRRCPQRAAPPAGRSLRVDEFARPATPYDFG